MKKVSLEKISGLAEEATEVTMHVHKACKAASEVLKELVWLKKHFSKKS